VVQLEKKKMIDNLVSIKMPVNRSFIVVLSYSGNPLPEWMFRLNPLPE
jgi:hypothetical protein